MIRACALLLDMTVRLCFIYVNHRLVVLGYGLMVSQELVISADSVYAPKSNHYVTERNAWWVASPLFQPGSWFILVIWCTSGPNIVPMRMICRYYSFCSELCLFQVLPKTYPCRPLSVNSICKCTSLSSHLQLSQEKGINVADSNHLPSYCPSAGSTMKINILNLDRSASRNPR